MFIKRPEQCPHRPDDNSLHFEIGMSPQIAVNNTLVHRALESLFLACGPFTLFGQFAVRLASNHELEPTSALGALIVQPPNETTLSVGTCVITSII